MRFKPDPPAVDGALLLRHPLLEGIAPSTTTMLNSTMRRTEWRASQVLLHRGDQPVGLILILEGRVRVIRELNGRRYVLHTERAGGALGEVRLFDHATMPATAIAVERTLGGRIPSTLGMTQEQFADELGTVREVLVRELGALVRDGTLTSLGRGRFLVQNLSALQARAAAG